MRPFNSRRVPVLTITSLMPLTLDDLLRGMVGRLVPDHLLNEAEFWLPYGLPSVAASEPSFEPDFGSGLIWRRPTWVNTDWFLIKALRAHGYPEATAELTARTVETLDRAGIRECFSPYTAEGYAVPRPLAGARSCWTLEAADPSASPRQAGRGRTGAPVVRRRSRAVL